MEKNEKSEEIKKTKNGNFMKNTNLQNETNDINNSISKSILLKQEIGRHQTKSLQLYNII